MAGGSTRTDLEVAADVQASHALRLKAKEG